MMKWLFFVLIVLNLGLFIWLYPQQNGEMKSTAMNHPVGDLRLVGEPISEVQESDETEESAAEKEAETAENLAESSVVKQGRKPAKPNLEQDKAEIVTTEKQCRTVGVFEKRSEAELISVQLRALGLNPEISSETSNTQAGFWVLIPARANRAEAVATAKNLEDVGVTDIWRFTSGELAHAISLGLFTDLERAQARREQIASLGFGPEVRPRFRQQTNYWVSYSFTGETPVSEGKWQELLQIEPQMEINITSCE
jgi:uncharacterized protein YjeT (DUF2065 family)/uncharacterized protein YheU (UPF0270 family)